MRNESHKTSISIIREHLEAWRIANSWSRETLAMHIVDAHYRIGGHEVTGIKFDPPSQDTFERVKANADRIYRWLDDMTKDKNLLPVNFERSILAALPEDRRLMLVDDLISPVGLSAHSIEIAGDEAIVVATHFQAVVEHSAEATVAMGSLLDGIDPGEPEHAKKKLARAADTMRRALGVVNRILHRGKRP